jgi:hypothetical protein
MVLLLGTMPSASSIQKQFAYDTRALTPELSNLGNTRLDCALPLAQSQHWMPTPQKLHGVAKRDKTIESMFQLWTLWCGVLGSWVQ